MLDWPEYGKLLVALWPLVHPLEAMPIFLSLTEDRPAERHHIGFVAATAMGVILIACVFAGQALLQAFGIHIPSFRIAGGILILFVAVAMMHTPSLGHRKCRNTHRVAGVPLAIPILAGPGAISTVIVYAHQRSSLSHHLLICAIIVTVATSTLVGLRLALVIVSLIGPTGMQVFTQIMRLRIAAIAVEFMTQGLAAIFPGWR